jgi:hypothetical protein
MATKAPRISYSPTRSEHLPQISSSPSQKPGTHQHPQIHDEARKPSKINRFQISFSESDRSWENDECSRNDGRTSQHWEPHQLKSDLIQPFQLYQWLISSLITFLLLLVISFAAIEVNSKTNSHLYISMYLYKQIEQIISTSSQPRCFYPLLSSYALSISFCADALCADRVIMHCLHRRLCRYHCLTLQGDDKCNILYLTLYVQFDFFLFIFSLSMVSSVHVTLGLGRSFKRSINNGCLFF